MDKMAVTVPEQNENIWLSRAAWYVWHHNPSKTFDSSPSFLYYFKNCYIHFPWRPLDCQFDFDDVIFRRTYENQCLPKNKVSGSPSPPRAPVPLIISAAVLVKWMFWAKLLSRDNEISRNDRTAAFSQSMAKYLPTYINIYVLMFIFFTTGNLCTRTEYRPLPCDVSLLHW